MHRKVYNTLHLLYTKMYVCLYVRQLQRKNSFHFQQQAKLCYIYFQVCGKYYDIYSTLWIISGVM